MAAGGTRGCRQALGDYFASFERGWFESWVQQGIELLRIDFQEGFLLVDHSLGNEIDRDFEGRGSSALAVSRLEHEELAPLDREFHVLHVTVMALEFFGDCHELFVNVRHDFLQLVNRLRCADPSDDVLALGVHQEFAVELLFTRGRVAGEGDAGA